MRRLYAGVTAIGDVVAAYILLARPRHLRWGTTDQEFDEPLPDDELIANADLTATRAITIRRLAEGLGDALGGLHPHPRSQGRIAAK
jgi:hypothetical protein